jgi:hypothetical protein
MYLKKNKDGNGGESSLPASHSTTMESRKRATAEAAALSGHASTV